MIKVLLVEDDPLVCRLLEVYFKMKNEFIVQYIDSAGIADACLKGNQVDLLLFDIGKDTNVMNIEEVENIRSYFPRVKIMMMTDQPEVSFIERARKAGMDSFWYKGEDLDELCSIMKRTVTGERVFPEKSLVVKFGDAQSDDMTLRELEVLREVIDGETDAVIAEKLHISIRTVKGHIQTIREKTGFRNRTELAVRARECGLVINARKNNDR